MRLAHTAFAFLISTGCVLALTADARAASCQTQQFQGQALEGNWQLQLGSNTCTPLTGVEVTVTVKQDIIVASSTEGYNGFSMQLNANGPSSGLTPSQLIWQQFVIHVGSGKVDGFTQQWPSGGSKQKVPNIYPGNSIFMGAPSTINNTPLTIKEGTTFTWKLNTDSKNNNVVESVTYSATDKQGTNYTPVTENIPAGDRAPIYSITMDIVGYNTASYTTFQSGAGSISYSAKSFSASYDFPSCAHNKGTGENSNIGYGPLNAASNGGFTQEFCVASPPALALAISGGDTECAVMYSGKLECWGNSEHGQVGNGSVTKEISPVVVEGLGSGIVKVVSVSAYDPLTCALMANKTVYCWGHNIWGQVGNDHRSDTPVTTPQQVHGLTDATAVAVGFTYACALRSGGTVECWGSNQDGTLGNGGTTPSSVPVAVSGLTNVTAISIGTVDSCALLSDGSVRCWGHGIGNKPVTVPDLTGVTAIAAGINNACALVSGGSMRCWSYGGHPGAVVKGFNGSIVAIAAGGDSDTNVCVVVESGAVQCFGDNYEGQLGNGQKANPTTPGTTTPVSVKNVSNATAVSVGTRSACALLSTGEVRCWGDNSQGELGDNSTVASSTPVPVLLK
jgi:hypothetical protein